MERLPGEFVSDGAIYQTSIARLPSLRASN